MAQATDAVATEATITMMPVPPYQSPFIMSALNPHGSPLKIPSIRELAGRVFQVGNVERVG